jgi:Na+-transporting NADH:ubiquinone oxidoreductase subunit NqrB
LVEYIYYNQEDDRIERRAADPILSRMFDPFIFNKMVTIGGVKQTCWESTIKIIRPQQFNKTLLIISIRLKAAISKLKADWNAE